MNRFIVKLTLLLIILINSLAMSEVRLKDITKIGGSTQRTVLGYGIVVGLEGTGDGSKSMFTVQSIANMLENYGVKVNKSDLKPKNVAAVMVTANMPTYAKKGTRIDVIVSSLGDAKSLQGGQLLITPLTDPTVQSAAGADVFAAGPISIGGFNIDAGNDNKFRKNYTLVGRIPDGGTIESEVKENLITDGSMSLNLNQPDYTTAVRIASSINNFFSQEIAYAVDRAEVKIKVPPKFQNVERTMEFIALLEPITVTTSEPAKVVVNERTGTIVIGEDVKLNAVAISHGNLSIKIESKKTTVQPNPLSLGKTTKDKTTTAQVDEQVVQVIQSDETPTLRNLVDVLNRLGVSPRDMISIFQALKEAGALHAELVLI